MKRLLLLITNILLLTACGGGSNSIENASQPLVSVFVNAPAKGVIFKTSSGLFGVTNANGEFNYRVGDVVEFSLDLGAEKIVIGKTTFTSAKAETSVLSLVGDEINSLAVSQILQTLDVGTEVGKMDLSGISLSPAVISSIKSGMRNTIDASARVSSIASELTNAGYTPKNGVSGVTTADAISRLSTQPSNQVHLKSIVTSIAEDATPLSVVYDKTYFVISYEVDSNGESSMKPYFEIIGSDGTFVLKSPSRSYSGAYVLSQDGKTGNYNDFYNRTGSFRIKIGGNSNYFLEHNRSDGLSGYLTGAIVSDLMVSDFFNKTISITNGCSEGVNAVYVFASDGSWTNSCGSVGKVKSTVSGTQGDNSSYCNTTSRGFLRPTPNAVCIENHTENTASLLAITSGSLSSSNGTGIFVQLRRIDEDTEGYTLWNFSY